MNAPSPLYDKSLSGHRLEGNKLVRFIYVDEAGISKHEPVAVVTGVIVHADTQWRPVAAKLGDLVKANVPAEHQTGFVFHGKELANGGRVFTREKYTLAERMRILAEVLSVPSQLQLPISATVLDKSISNFNGLDQLNGTPLQSAFHGLAFALCLINANKFVRDHFPDEIAQVVVEHNNEMQDMLKRMPAMLNILWESGALPESLKDGMPITHIVGPVHFAKKQEEPHLQIADGCAYAIRRYFSRLPYGEELVRALYGDDFRNVFLDKRLQSVCVIPGGTSAQ